MAPDEEQRIDLLARAWLAREPDENSRRLLRRLEFAGLAIDVATLVRDVARSARTLPDVVLREEALAWDVRQQLARHAPDRLKVPSGREMTLEYPGADRVEVAVKLQELFGLAETPRLGPRQLPVTFHLLAPNGRPVQTTSDLRSFWERTYPEVRKELRGRYPKHPWPEDPWKATPTHRSTRGAARAAE